MSSPSVMKRLGDSASKYVSGLKSLAPGDSEVAGLKATQQNVDEASKVLHPDPAIPAAAAASKSGSDLIHPMAKYGDRSGEKRLDSQGNVIPVPAYDKGGDVRIMSPMMYDQGGDVKASPVTMGVSGKAPTTLPNSTQDKHTNVSGNAPTTLPIGGKTMRDKNDVESEIKPAPMAPLYDEGGDVGIDAGRRAQSQGDADVQALLNSPDAAPTANSGTAAPAKMDLSGLGKAIGQMRQPGDQAQAPEWMPATAQSTPDMAAPSMSALGQQNQQPGLPVLDCGGDVKMQVYDDGGPVDVNDGQHQIAVLKDGEKVLNPQEADAYRAGQKSAQTAAAPTEVASAAQPVQTNAEGAPAEGAPAAKIPADSDTRGPNSRAKTTPDTSYAGEQIKPAAPDQAITEAGMKENGTHPSQQPAPVQMQNGTPAERQAITVDKQKAMGMGLAGLVPLGLANIHEGQLGEQPGAMEQGATPPAALAQPKGPGMPQMNTEPTAPAAPAAPVQMDRKAKIADYDAKIQAALDSATPEGKELADRLSYAKQAYEHHTPWGSAENHPGFLGKLAHGAAEVGNIAGDIVAPRTMAIIPGTDLNRRGQEAGMQKMTAQDTTLNTARADEVAKTAKTAPAQEQLIAAGTALQAAKDSKDPASILKAQQSYDNIVSSFNAKEVPPVKEDVPENRLADANMALQKAQAAGDPAAIQTAQNNVKAITDAINAKTGAAAAPATPEDVKDYQTRVGTVLAAMPDGPAKDAALKTYGTAPAGTTKAELDKRFDEASRMRTMGDTEAQTKVANQARDDAAAAKKVEEAGKVYDKYSTAVDKVKDPMDATGARAGLAIKNLDLKTKTADALVAPEILTLAAGGQGSGLRMNEAEIRRIVGGASAWDTIVQKANFIVQNGGTFDDKQRAELRKVASYIQERSAGVSSVLDKTRQNMLAGQGDEAAVRAAYDNGKKVASAIEQKGITPAGDKLKPGDYVFHDGQVLIVGDDYKGKPAL